MEKKYSLSKNQIIAQEQGTIRDICASVLGNNKDLVIAKIWELARDGDKQMILLLAEIGALDE